MARPPLPRVALAMAAAALAIVPAVGAGATPVAPQQVDGEPISDVEALASVGAGADRRITSPTPPATGPHDFLFTIGGEYARWDPCTPIKYAVNGERATPAQQQALFDAVFRLELEMGLDFAFVGFTDQGLNRDVPSGADAVIAFSDGNATPLLEPGVLGLGGGAFDPFELRVTQGFVIVNTPAMTTPEITRTTLQHEIGHLVGLAHVADPGQLMFPQDIGNTDFGPGDREGLWKLGAAQGCLPPSASTPRVDTQPLADGMITVYALTEANHLAEHHHHGHHGHHGHHEHHDH